MTKKLAFGFRLSWNVDRKVNQSMIRFMLRTMVFFCLIGEIWGEMAAANDIALLPFLALGFFCGIRPNGELEEIEWRDISLKDKVVTIRSEVSKTRTRRFVALSENAVEWLKLCPTKSPSTRIVPFSFNVLRGLIKECVIPSAHAG